MSRTPILPSAPLHPSDDYPLHQTAETLVRVASDNPRWTERWYFNLQRPDGSLVGVCGGGFYPNTGVLEVYACVLHNDRQLNLRQRVIEFDRTRVDAAPAVTFDIDSPMRSWKFGAHGPAFKFDLQFEATAAPYLFPPFVTAADLPHQATALQIDTVQHFVQPGDVQGALRVHGESIELSARSFRDRTWGTRTSRPRLHQWYVLHLADGSQLNLIHQERADGTVMVSHIARVDADGRIETGVIDSHALSFDPKTRQLLRGRYQAHTGDGVFVEVSVDNIGHGVRLLGAGYTDSQGAASQFDAVQSDEWDLGDAEVAAAVGKGTIDSPVVGHVVWGNRSDNGIGITETAIARNHWRYGSQLS